MHPTLRIALGVVFVILGIIGSFLPVLQGWLFFVIALLLFFPRHPKAAAFMKKIEPKFPRLARWLRKAGIGDDDPSAATGNVSAIMPRDDQRSPRT